MDAQEIARGLDKILWGKSFVNLDNQFTPESTVVLRSLNISESNLVNHIYENTLAESLSVGILCDEDMRNFYEENDVWGERDEIEMETIKRQIKLLKSQIKDAEFFPVKQKQLKKKLKASEDKLRNKNNTKLQLFNCSAESRASEISRRFMVMMSTENMDGTPRWKSQQDFLEECDIDLIYQLAISYYKFNIFPEAELRAMARSPQWRFRWVASKNGADLFGKSISDWSEMQDALVYWSQFYDYVFDNPDRPNPIIINDDDACDAWVEEQLKSRRLGGGKNKQRSKPPRTQRSGKQTGARQEQFVMVKPGDADTVQRVQEMNPKSVRHKLQNEHKKIQESGKRLTEWQLRGREYLQTLEGGN